jgi:signal transduction histidine kinase
MPGGKDVSIAHLATGQEDGQWVAIEGIVRSVVSANSVLYLTFAHGANRVTAMTPSAGGSNMLPYLDSKVRLCGVCCVALNERKERVGFNLLLSDLSQIQVEEPGPAEESLAVQPIRSLMVADPRIASGHRVRARGAVTLRRDQRTIFIQDSTGGMCAQLAREFKAELGDQLEIVGFPRNEEAKLVLEDATATLLAHGAPPIPVAATIAQIQTGQFGESLVKLQGRILEQEGDSPDQGLLLQTGKFLFTAALAQPPAKGVFGGFAKGSLVEVTGVCQARVTGSGDRILQLLIESPADIRVLKKPSWWTAQRTLWVLSCAGAALFVSLAWAGALGKLVRQRTAELGAEIEQHERAETRLKAEIAERGRMEILMAKTHQELLNVSRQAGMAEVATNVLHNVGNVLNSVNISTDLIVQSVKKSRASSLARVVALLQEHAQDLGAFITQDSRGKHVPAHLAQLSEHLLAEQETNLRELDSLRQNVEHIKEIVAMQQNYATFGGVKQLVNVVNLVEDSLRMNEAALSRHEVEVIREFGNVPPLNVEKHKILQILLNLLRNAKYACDDSERADKRLTVRVANGGSRIKVSVIDNGVGIAPENLTRIFNYGFTTRKGGHGFGLHGGALAAKEMGGSLTAHSDGPGQGAEFTLELPCPARENPHE